HFNIIPCFTCFEGLCMDELHIVLFKTSFHTIACLIRTYNRHIQQGERAMSFQRLIGFTGVKMVFSSIQNSHPKIEIRYVMFLTTSGFHHIFSCQYAETLRNMQIHLYPMNFTGIMGQRSE
ncbi:hypothetical protein ACJX0J_008585, partial [Zea mays]